MGPGQAHGMDRGAPAAPRRRASSRRGIALLAAWLAFGCGAETVDRVPGSLLGRWESEAPRYENRWFEVRPAELVWGMGRFEVYVHAIEAIERAQTEDGATAYRFHYTESDGYEEVQELRVDPGPPLRIRLGRREEPWHRVSGPS